MASTSSAPQPMRATRATRERRRLSHTRASCSFSPCARMCNDAPGVTSTRDSHNRRDTAHLLAMVPKVEVLSAFQHFQHSDIDLTLKRSPGTYFREAGAEEKPAAPRPSRARPQSAPPPPSAMEASWSFHHQAAPCSEVRSGPRLYCKSAAESSYDKVSASLACDLFKCTAGEARPASQRRLGQFSPQASEITPEASRASSVVGDFHMRGVLDIDRNLRRGTGLGRTAQETTVDVNLVFSEEREALLKRSLANPVESHSSSDQLPDYIGDLDRLGVDCRRLLTATLSHSESQKTLGRCPQHAAEFEPLRNLTPLRRQSQNPAPSPVKVRPQADAPLWIGELDGIGNMNARRLHAAYSRASLRPCKSSKPVKKDKAHHERMVSLPNLLQTPSPAPPELALPRKDRCSTGSTTCSTIDEEELERSGLANVTIPKLPMHLLDSTGELAKRCPANSDCSTDSAAGEDSDGESSMPSCATPLAPRRSYADQAEC